MPAAPASTRRDFLTAAAAGAAVVAARPSLARQQGGAGVSQGVAEAPKSIEPVAEPLKLLGPDGLAALPPLGFAADALMPHIDGKTMEIHHDGHHRAYVKGYNEAVGRAPELKGRAIQEVLADLGSVPKHVRRAVRNNGGGHYNHALFWTILDPADSPGPSPVGELATAIDAGFGSFDRFKQEFGTAAGEVFGSGWAWLARKGGKLTVVSTPNQDTPAAEGAFPILGLDVWEHAYYLKHQNKRADYVESWWNVVNWRAADERFRASAG